MGVIIVSADALKYIGGCELYLALQETRLLMIRNLKI